MDLFAVEVSLRLAVGRADGRETSVWGGSVMSVARNIHIAPGRPMKTYSKLMVHSQSKRPKNDHSTVLSYPDGPATSAFEQLVFSLNQQTFPTELYTYRTRHPPASLGQRWFALLIAIHAMVCKE